MCLDLTTNTLYIENNHWMKLSNLVIHKRLTSFEAGFRVGTTSGKSIGCKSKHSARSAEYGYQVLD